MNKTCSTHDLEQIQRWKKRLLSLTELQLPTDYPRPIPLRVVEAEHCIDVTEASSLAILKLSLAEGGQVSPFSVLLTAFSILLHRYTGEEDISVGSSSRSSNPLVLRMKVASSDTVTQVLQNVVKVGTEISNS